MIQSKPIKLVHFFFHVQIKTIQIKSIVLDINFMSLKIDHERPDQTIIYFYSHNISNLKRYVLLMYFLIIMYYYFSL